MEALEAKQTKPSEAESLGMEMAAAFAHMVEFHREHWGLTTQEAIEKVNEPPVDVTAVRKFRPDQVTWMDFVELTKGKPERGGKLWEQLQQIASRELKSGHRAAKVVEGATSMAFERAKFISLRDDLAAQWKPRNGIEWTLIDTIAQAFAQYEMWMTRLMLYSTLEFDEAAVKAKNTFRPPRVSDSDAINQAAAMADRFNRIFLRSIRA